MSDSCYLSVTVEAGRLDEFKMIVFNGNGAEVQESSDLAVNLVDYEANYALYDELVKAAAAGILFHGYHAAGGEYGSGSFFSKDGLYHEWEISQNNNGYFVAVKEDGTIPQDRQEELRMFVLARADAERRLEDALYSLITDAP